METAAGAESHGSYRGGQQDEQGELDLAVRLQPLLQFIKRLVERSRAVNQTADIEDVVQDVFRKLAPKMRERALEELFRLARGAVKWCIADHLSKSQLPGAETRSDLDVLAAQEYVAPEKRQFRPEFLIFITGLSPVKARLCTAMFSGYTGVAELARVALVPERRIGVLLAEVVFHAMETFPLLGQSLS